MSEMFKKLVESKKAEGKSMSPVEHQASDDVLANLMHYLNGMEGDKVKGIKKVTVAAGDNQDLQKGLDKAKELVSGKGDEMGEEPSEVDSQEDGMSEEDMPEGDEDDSSFDDQSASEEDSPESLKKQIEMLKAQLASKGN